MVGVEARGLVEDFAVPFEGAGLEAAEDFGGRAVYGTGDVDVFDPHEPLAAVRAGVEEAGERGYERALVEGAGG